MKLSRLKKQNTIPASQNQLAAYLGIKSSTLSMGNSAKYRRTLPSGISEKLAGLYSDFALMEFQPNQPGRSSVKIKVSEDKALRDVHKHLLREGKYLEDHIVVLARKFDEMCSVFTQNIRWLHVIDARLAAFPTKNERIWLDYQKVITIERIEKNGTLAQFKLQLKIELARAKATAYRNISKTIAAGLEEI